ncbi:MAG: response regulator [Bacteroidetes bacterium]|jgi:two-component system, cell cycle response regulator DivK|nr:response regulator [Bacteroidota bacterium]MBT5527597.1 response regulator [Cytophagia bacterium]MBT3422598.1 response regulator [Bacteroidota bacterium]MBT3802115.1 response regulator [Bacteroidota bacterium]MBT3934509.1 response regulator [Bacteroidota bacterium]
METNTSKPAKPDQFLQGYTILVAEDEEFNYRYLQKLLSMRGCQTIWAKNGIEIFETINNNIDFDLVLMDIKMPKMDGYEASTKLKQILPDLPIIAQTAFALYGDSEKAFEAGCDDYIAKPIMLNDLMAKLKFHLKLN